MAPLCLRSVQCAALDACGENMKDGTKGRTAEVESGTQTHSESVTENNNGWKQILHDVSSQHKPQKPRATQRPNLIEAKCERTNKGEQREEITAAHAPSPLSSSSLPPVLPRRPHDTMSQVLSHYLNRKKRPFVKPIHSLHTIKESTATDSHHQHQPCEVATSPTDPEGWKRIRLIQQQDKTKSQQPTCTDKQKAMISQRYQTKCTTFPIVRGI